MSLVWNGETIGATAPVAGDTIIVDRGGVAAEISVASLLGGISVVNTYTATGTISISDDLSVIINSGTSAITLTVPNDTIDKHTRIVKRLGSGPAIVVGNYDGSQQSIPMYETTSVTPAIISVWSAELATNLVY